MTTEQQYAAVTGGTSGIGHELAKLLAKDNYHLILVARDESELNRAKVAISQETRINVITLAKDLFDPSAAFEIYDFVKAKGLQPAILVNDAGQGIYGEFINTDIKRELDIIQLNICSLVILTKLFLKDMVQAGKGKILNVSSIASKVPGPFQSVYYATKAFVQSFSQAIRNEVSESGVTITLPPGVTDTDFFNKADMLESKAVQGEMADPADVAKDGYEALMKGDDMVVSGMKNKMQVAMAAIAPDTTLAAKVHKQQAPIHENEQR